MSIDYGNLCSVILKQCFGDVVQIVGDCLFAANSRTLFTIIKVTNLSKKQVSLALAILIKYQLVQFRASDTNPAIAEYSLKREEILFILRYSRYVHLMQTKYGAIGASIAEELLQNGPQTGTQVILKCLTNEIENDGGNMKPEILRDTFVAMIKDNYLIKLPKPLQQTNDSTIVQPTLAELDNIPKLHIEDYDLYNPPDLDLFIINKIHNGMISITQANDSDIYWQLNFNRFHQEFRDHIMINAIEHKLGASAGECFRYILKQAYERTDPWQRHSSNPFTFIEIKHLVEKNSKNLDLIRYLDQYVALIADDSLHFIHKTGDMGGGQYVVDMPQAFNELTLCCIEGIITERFGSKASRIFRVVRLKKYIEQENLQKEAMIPAKEAKLLAYSLFQEQFLQIKIIRKAGGGGSGPAKAFYLFHLKYNQIVKMLLDMCYKALYNNITRSNHEKNEHQRLIEKSQKLDSIVTAMRERGESEDYIAEILETLTPPEREILDKVKQRMKILCKAELNTDDTIFILQLYMYLNTQLPTTVTTTRCRY